MSTSAREGLDRWFKGKCRKRGGSPCLYSIIMKETIRSLFPLYIFAGVLGYVALTKCVHRLLFWHRSVREGEKEGVMDRKTERERGR